MLRPKKEAPFPKGGLFFLLIAGLVSVILSSLISMPISAAIEFIRLGATSDPQKLILLLRENPQGFADYFKEISADNPPNFFATLISMFFSAGLLEEGLKYLTCRIAIRRKGMIRTWMDCVIAFSVVGITFELLENIAFGLHSGLLDAFLRALAAGHFIFGTIMGYFFGKYRVTGQKKYCWLSLFVPVIYHTVTNSIMGADLSAMPVFLINATAISHMVVALILVILVLRWQKNKTLDVPVQDTSALVQDTAASVQDSAASENQTANHREKGNMRTIIKNDYALYPRRFDAYRWYKPLIVFLIAAVSYFIIGTIVVDLLTKVIFGATVTSTGYDNMDFYSAAGAFYNGAQAACVIPCIFLAALIVRDRPISSYCSSVGGWRWKVFLKTMLVGFLCIGLPMVIWHLVHGRTGGIRFTVSGFILLTLFVPLQGFAEELTYRSFFLQTVSSWFKLPVAGLIVQILLFTATHPYNLAGRIEIALSALLYCLVCMYSRGLEAPTAMHIANNMSEIYMAGFGFGAITAQETLPDIIFNLVIKVLFFLCIMFAGKKWGWFDQTKKDDVARFHAKTARK